MSPFFGKNSFEFFNYVDSHVAIVYADSSLIQDPESVMSSIRKHFKEIKDMVDQFTSDHIIELTKGGHLSIQLRHNGNKRTVFAPQTPSDHRSMLDVKRKVRLAYNELAQAA